MRKRPAGWTSKQRATLKRLMDAGLGYGEAGRLLGHARSSVRSRALAWGYARRSSTFAAPDVEYPTARVPKQLVIDWYEIGWRVLGIGATDCVLEWRLSRSPEYPHACKVDAAPTRVLEDA